MGSWAALLDPGICSGNLASLLVPVLPITAAFPRRTSVEGGALSEAQADDCGAYAARTKRLIPGVYWAPAGLRSAHAQSRISGRSWPCLAM